ncbi:hypothetical protein [Gloeobacter kilaueensis]|uniref:Uncharacterized protein n=1 Tax=Gloeobacter kilaueensis (strain ATCC BAA-2537 / CCAP 1431/1 / ULC 316 / JS1) TaxID=1183438 RepID=U5QKF3_GLOK1|nr:hypothetical protein [Gloeobacter kilaueensis]AGY59333.1 hypothetical protein GKIL_3087 [Gloeobacter kilaueensis JS1]
MHTSSSLCLALALTVAGSGLLLVPAHAQAFTTTNTLARTYTYTKKRARGNRAASVKEQCLKLTQSNAYDPQLLVKYDKLKCDQVLAAKKS